MRKSISHSLALLALAMAAVVALPDRGKAQNYDTFQILRFSDRTVYIVPKGYIPNELATVAAAAYALPTATLIDPRLWTTSAFQPQTAPENYYYGASIPVSAPETSITLRVPPSAKVWINGKEMTQAGAERRFVLSPPDSFSNHDYEVRAQWTENGREKSVTNHMEMRFGDQKSITFVAALAGPNGSSGNENAKSDMPMP
jgi:uncharacterized protein (TIGR03000 family)